MRGFARVSSVGACVLVLVATWKNVHGVHRIVCCPYLTGIRPQNVIGRELFKDRSHDLRRMRPSLHRRKRTG